MQDLPINLVIIAVMAISGWITTIRLRRRVRRALRRDVSDAELTSINTWMEVADEEEKDRFYISKG